MKVITTREIKVHTKTFFELAEKERVAVKRGKNKYVNLIVSEDPDEVFVSKDWIDNFLKIPAEYRCNPFDINPSGDIFWADKRNVDTLKKSIKTAEKQKKEGKVTRIKNPDELSTFLDSL